MIWKEIESRQNEAVKLASSLASKKERDRHGLFLAEGVTLLFDFLSYGLIPSRLYVARSSKHLEEVRERFSDVDCLAYLLSDAAFEKVTSEKGSEGVLSLYSVQDLKKILPVKSEGKWIALENLQDPGNVGTVIRTAAAFGFDGVLTVGCADPFGPKAVRASMGAIARIPVDCFSDTEALFSFLRQKSVHTVAACLHSESVSIGAAHLAPPVCVLIGNEGRGLSPVAIEKADERSIIPIRNTESLNAATAASVFMWEISRREEMK